MAIVNTLRNCPYGSIWYRELAKHGIKFVDNDAYLDVAPESFISLSDAIASSETIVLYWRWLYDGMTDDKKLAYEQQQKLLDKCPERCIVLDGDHMLTDSDSAELSKLGCRVVTTELFAPNKLMNPYFKSLERKIDHRSSKSLVYVGTPIDRVDQMSYWCSNIDVDLYGSWQGLDLNSRHVAHGKLDNCKVLDTLQGRVTLVLAKQSYYASAYITPRWYECAWAGCAGIIPNDYAWCMPEYLQKWVVSTSSECSDMFELLSNDEDAFVSNVNDFRKFSQSISGTEQWLSL